jgi:alpha-1,2-mannosyltransferase
VTEHVATVDRAPAAPNRLRRLLRQPRAQVITLLAAVATVSCILWYRGNPHRYFDLKIYISAMKWWAAGHPLYDFSQPDPVQGSLGFTYPPFAAVVMRPLASIPLGASIAVMWLWTAALLSVAMYWLLQPIAKRHGWPVWYAVALGITAAALLEPIRQNVLFGQLNLILVGLILGDLLVLGPRHSRWFGVGIGLATAIKLIPGIFIVYLLITRRWRPAGTSVCAAIGATLVAAAVAPRDSWVFWTSALWDTDRVGRTDYAGNQSINGLLSRLDSGGHPNRAVWLVLAALVLGYGLWRARRAAAAGDEVVGLTLVGIVGSLVSPITWPHHLFWFIPAFVVLIDAAVTSAGLRRARLVAPLVVGYVTLAIGLVFIFDSGLDPKWSTGLSGFLLLNWDVLLMAGLLIMLPIRSNAPAYSTGSRNDRATFATA